MGSYGSFIVTRRVGGDFKTFPINKKEFLIGKQLTCDVRIYLPQIADNHCKISFEKEGQATLINLSKNGTMINGEKLGEQDRRALKDQDIITIHDRTFRFEYTAPNANKPQSTVHLSKPLRPISRSKATANTPLSKSSTRPFHAATTPLTNQVKGHIRAPLTEPSKKGTKPLFGARNQTNEFTQLFKKTKLEHEEQKQRIVSSLPGEHQTDDSNLKNLKAKTEETIIKCEAQLDTINDKLTTSSQILSEAHQAQLTTPSVVDNRSNSHPADVEPIEGIRPEADVSTADQILQTATSPKLPKALFLMNTKSPKKRKSLDTTSLMQPRSPGRRSSRRRSSLLDQSSLLGVKIEQASSETPVPDTNTLVEENSRRKVTFGPDLSPEIYDRALPPNSPLKRGRKTPSGTPALGQSKLRDAIEDSPEPTSVRRVTFGPDLSPEIFDKSLPPNSPLKKGRDISSANNTPQGDFVTAKPSTPSSSLLKNVLKQFRAKEDSPITLDSNEESVEASVLALELLNDVTTNSEEPTSVSTDTDTLLVGSNDNSDDSNESVPINSDDKLVESVESAETENCPSIDSNVIIHFDDSESHIPEDANSEKVGAEEVANDAGASSPSPSQPDEEKTGPLTPEKRGPEISATFTSDSTAEGVAIAELFDATMESVQGEPLPPSTSEDMSEEGSVTDLDSESMASHCSTENTELQHEEALAIPAEEQMESEVTPSNPIQKEECDSRNDDETEDHDASDDQLPLSPISAYDAPTTPQQTMPSSEIPSESVRQGECIAELFATPPSNSKSFSDSPSPMAIDSPTLSNNGLPGATEIVTPTRKPPNVSTDTCESTRQGEAIAKLLATPSPKASEEKFYTPDSISDSVISQQTCDSERTVSAVMDTESFIEGEAIATLLSTPIPSLPESPLSSKFIDTPTFTSGQFDALDSPSDKVNTSSMEASTSTEDEKKLDALESTEPVIPSEIDEATCVVTTVVELNEDVPLAEEASEVGIPDVDETMMEVDFETKDDMEQVNEGQLDLELEEDISNDHVDDDEDVEETIAIGIGEAKESDGEIQEDLIERAAVEESRPDQREDSNQVEESDLLTDKAEDSLEQNESAEVIKESAEEEKETQGLDNDAQTNAECDTGMLVFEHVHEEETIEESSNEKQIELPEVVNDDVESDQDTQQSASHGDKEKVDHNEDTEDMVRNEDNDDGEHVNLDENVAHNDDEDEVCNDDESVVNYVNEADVDHKSDHENQVEDPVHDNDEAEVENDREDVTHNNGYEVKVGNDHEEDKTHNETVVNDANEVEVNYSSDHENQVDDPIRDNGEAEVENDQDVAHNDDGEAKVENDHEEDQTHNETVVNDANEAEVDYSSDHENQVDNPIRDNGEAEVENDQDMTHNDDDEVKVENDHEEDETQNDDEAAVSDANGADVAYSSDHRDQVDDPTHDNIDEENVTHDDDENIDHEDEINNPPSDAEQEEMDQTEDAPDGEGASALDIEPKEYSGNDSNEEVSEEGEGEVEAEAESDEEKEAEEEIAVNGVNHEEISNNEDEPAETTVAIEQSSSTLEESGAEMETTPKRNKPVHESSSEDEKSSDHETTKSSPSSIVTTTRSTRSTRKVNRPTRRLEPEVETEAQSRPTRSSKRVTRSDNQVLPSVRTRSTRTTRASKVSEESPEEMDTPVRPRSNRQKVQDDHESESEKEDLGMVMAKQEKAVISKSKKASRRTKKTTTEETNEARESDAEEVEESNSTEVADVKTKVSLRGKRSLEESDPDEHLNVKTRSKKARKNVQKDEDQPDVDEISESLTVTRRSKKSKKISQKADVKPEPSEDDAVTEDHTVNESPNGKISRRKRTSKNETEQVAAVDEPELEMKHVTRRGKRTAAKNAPKAEKVETISKEEAEIESKPKTRRSKRAAPSADEPEVDKIEENVIEETKITTRRTNRATKPVVKKTRSTRNTKRAAKEEEPSEQPETQEVAPDSPAEEDLVDEAPRPKRVSKRTKAEKSSTKKTSKAKTSTKKSKDETVSEVNGEEEAEMKPSVTKTTRSRTSKAAKSEEKSEEITTKRPRSSKRKADADVEEEEVTKPVTRKRAKPSTRSQDVLTTTKISVRQTRSRTRKN